MTRDKIPAPSIDNLCNILNEEIHNLRGGKTTPANVNAITNAVGKMIASVRLQMDYQKLLGRVPKIKLIED